MERHVTMCRNFQSYKNREAFLVQFVELRVLDRIVLQVHIDVSEERSVHLGVEVNIVDVVLH